MNSIYTEDPQFYDLLAPIVFQKVRPAALWVYRYVYREKLSERDGVDIAKTALFEAKHENPLFDEEALIAEAVRIYRSYLWAKGTPAYESIRMSVSGRIRARMSSEAITHFPWGAEITSGPATLINTNETEIPSIGTLFENLEHELGAELAIIYVLHHAYGWSISKVTKYMLGTDPYTDKPTFLREYRRVTRMLEDLDTLVKTCYVSRKST